LRVATLSDLHTDFEANREVLVRLAVAIHAAGADAVVVAGDISHREDRIARTLEALRVAAPVVAYIPGNHDLWFDVPDAPRHPELDTWRRYHVDLKAVAEGVGAHYLPAGPLRLGKAAVAGTCGWYDYSLMLPAIRAQVPDEALAAKHLGGVMWSDVRFVSFRDATGALMDDAAVARRMEAELAAHLAALDADPEVEAVLAVTHHLPFDAVVQRSGTLPWEFFNAFMGSRGLGEVIRGARKVRAAVYGHTHVVGRFEVEGLLAYGTPLGYPRERVGLDVDAVVASRIGWVTLPD
jgi:3',5'-cyclic AMP phosphodiesterase CpdA